MKKQSKKYLDDYFNQLKASIPSSDQRPIPRTPEKEEKLLDLLKHSLTVIEAVYLQSPETFPMARVEEYQLIIQSLSELGYDYHAQGELIEQASKEVLISAKLPMKKANTQGGKQFDRENDQTLAS